MHAGGLPTAGIRESARRHLAAMLGPNESFRRGQLEAIEAVIAPGARALVVQRTGWGKSLVYWIATRIRRDAGAGPTLIVSPLLSLMRNQIAMAGKLNLRAESITSENQPRWTAIAESLSKGEIDVLLVSPERLGNEVFITNVLPALGGIGLFVIDEAHCISDWGHDFRPDYRRLGPILDRLPGAIPVLATTATANDRVVADVAEQLGSNVMIQRGTLARDSLDLHVIPLVDQAERLAWLAENLASLIGSGIVYCLTVADSVRVSKWLEGRGFQVLPYHAGLSTQQKVAAEEALLANGVKALVATTALGMGFDKPDLGFVVHYQRPGSTVAYYQQVGRAGRAVARADAVLLTGREDDEIAEYFIDSAFPAAANQRAIVEALERRTEMTVPQLEREVNVRHSEIEKILQLAEIDGGVGRERGHYFRTTNPWAPDVERATRVTALRHGELAQMREYTAQTDCLMRFLRLALDDPGAVACRHCQNDGARALPSSVSDDTVQAAVRFLRRDARPLEPRKQWPFGAVSALRGRIHPEQRTEVGRALSMYGDAGWGRLVREGKYKIGSFDRRLVDASVELVRAWAPSPPPTWITSVPSGGHPALVHDFTEELAQGLGLPFKSSLVASPGAQQKAMENGAQRVRNVHAKISLAPGMIDAGPVLLVDDIFDSGWTIAYAGYLLREAGVEAVFPFALAIASNRVDA